MQLPQWERRPTGDYYIGLHAGKALFTPSVGVNMVRLASAMVILVSIALITVVPMAVLGIIGGGAGIGFTVWCTHRRTMAQKEPDMNAEDWTSAEDTFAEQLTQAIQKGQFQTFMRTHANDLMIDYGQLYEKEATRTSLGVMQGLRDKHQLVIGGSGSGKSKFVATQEVQSVVAGASLVLVDPHEELAQDILRSAAHLLSIRGCVFIWPDGPMTTILPWNPLWVGPGREAWQAADLVVAAIKRVWELSDANTFIIDALKHTVWALAAAGWTLLEGPRFLNDERFRAYITEQANLPDITRWVVSYDAMHPRDRQNLSQTTLVRLNRLAANPHIKRLIGCGVTDMRYQQALTAAQMTPIPGIDLCAMINRGVHVFAVLPVRTLGEDQYLMAGLVQSAMLTAAFQRRPNDPHTPETRAVLDEAGAYASEQGLGKILAQTRKYKLSATIALQDPGQAEVGLLRELKTNTAIKAIFGTDNSDTAEWAAQTVFGYQPQHIKMDLRERIVVDDIRREVGSFQTYSPQEQLAFWQQHILSLPPRRYILKITGHPETLQMVTPHYQARYTLDEALTVLHRRQTRMLFPSVPAVDAELAFRAHWLDTYAYQHISPYQAQSSSPTRSSVQATCDTSPDDGVPTIWPTRPHNVNQAADDSDDELPTIGGESLIEEYHDDET